MTNSQEVQRCIDLQIDRRSLRRLGFQPSCNLIERDRVHGDLLASVAAAGRLPLEFLCQELNREINTIGSKANDVEIARRVVDTKGAIERIREIVQNVE